MKAVKGKVIVELQEQEKPKHGLMLPDSAKRTVSHRATVIDIHEDDYKELDCIIGIGSDVIIAPHRGVDITFNNKKLYIVGIKDILAVVK